MLILRSHPSGCLIAPHRGDPPPAPPGYEPTGDPYTFAIKLQDCPYRQTKKMKKSCCGTVTILYCNKYKDITTRLKCKECVKNGQDL